MSILEKGKILVTGGAGFIGSSLIWELNQRGYENILVTDLLGSDDKFKNLVPLRFDDYVEADTFHNQLSTNSSVYKDISCIFHLGANSATTETDCRKLLIYNYEYTKSLAIWAISNKKRFVYASSAATYGNGAKGMSDQDEKQIPDFRPLNMYGYSKQLFDLYALRNNMLGKIVGLKYFNIFGPNEHHKEDMRSVVHKAFEQIAETGKVKLFKSYHKDYKDGEQLRDFYYVKDAVNMTLFLAEQPKANGIFNIGSGQSKSWISLVTPIFKAMNKEVNIEFIDMPETLREKYQYFTEANIDRIRAAGYDKETTTLSDAVTDYVKNYLMPGTYLGD